MENILDELKTWERDFKAIHGRKPELKDTPEPILNKYKLVLEHKKRQVKLQASFHEPIVLPRCNPTVTKRRPLPAPAAEARNEEEGEPIAMEIVHKNSKPKPAAASFEHLKRIKVDTKIVQEDEDDKPMDVTEYLALKKTSTATAASYTAPTPTTTTTTTTTNNSIFASFKKSEPNFVKLNLKKDWKESRKKLPGSAKPSKPKRDYSMDSEANSKPDVISTILDLIEDATTPAADLAVAAVDDEEEEVKICCGHNLPCQIFTVKKVSNRGRKFYGCSLGWQATCGFFQWKDDTTLAAKAAFVRGTRNHQHKEEEAAHTKLISAMSVSELKFNLSRLRLVAPKSAKRCDLVDALNIGWALRMEEANALQNSLSNNNDSNVDLLRILNTVFFHDDFHPQQLCTIERLLVKRENALLVSSTGSGKSLVYQLPAFVLPHLTIVISPLISLMLDQAAQLPPGMRGNVLMGTQAQQATVLADAIAGRIKLLYVSPERIFTQSFQTLARKLVFSLVCVDEAHCMTSWSHNFRPCYLRLGEVIPKLFPRALVLALTATATVAVQREICQSLQIYPNNENSNGNSWKRDNLQIEIHHVETSAGKRFTRLVNMLKEQSSSCSTIIYCSTKYETTLVAERLVSQHGIKSVAAYHAGLEHKERKQTQERFLSNKLQVVVATVAFGMGLNKPNVRTVVHYGMPRSVEEYAQEIGRAGRDGQLASCLCFYDVEEAQRLLSLSKSDGMERTQLKLLLDLLRRPPPPTCTTLLLPVFCKETSLMMDCKESTVETLLVFLSQRNGMLELVSNGYGRAQVQFGARKANCPTIIHALQYLGGDVVDLLALLAEMKRSTSSSSGEEGELALANVIRQLNAAKEDGFLASLSLIDPCWFVKVLRPFNGEDDVLLGEMQTYCDSLEHKAGESVQFMYAMCELAREQGAEEMKCAISHYLEATVVADGNLNSNKRIPMRELDDIAKRAILGDAKSLLNDSQFALHRAELKTARAIARLFHGITSVVFTFDSWSKHRLWGRHKDYDFDAIKSFLQQEMKRIN